MKKQIIRVKKFGRDVDVAFEGIALQHEAILAAQLAERWGMVAAIPEGEDSAGRSKVRMATPEEITTRACDTAAQLFAEFGRRGWVLEYPFPPPNMVDED